MIEGLIIGLLFSYMLFVMGNLIFNKKKKYNYKIFIVQLVYIFLYLLNYMYNEKFNIFIEFLLMLVYFKIIFKENILKIIYTSIIIYGIQYLLEFVIFTIDETIFYYIQILKFLSSHAILKSTLMISLTALTVYLLKNKLHKFLAEDKIYSVKYIAYTVLIVILTPILIYIRNYGIHKFPEVQLFIEILLFIPLVYISYMFLKQKKQIENISRQYTETTNYYKMAEGLLEEYRYILHENKNQLLIIKSMIKENSELEEYLNQLINGRRNLQYEWVCDLKNIPIQGLKGLVNYKVAEMKKKKLNVEIYIDDEIGNIKVKNLNQKEQHDLYSIMGILLDNALEASSISKEKMVSIQCYKEKQQIHIMIANTYVGEVNLNKIKEIGYSSKGKNRGIGLPLVDKIVKNSSIYKNETELFDIFFVQHLYINLPNNTKN